MVAIFRLESNQAMQRWLESPERTQLAVRVEQCLAESSHLQVLASDDQAEPPVAMVFTHRVRSDKVDAYRAWRQKTIAAQAKYPGYSPRTLSNHRADSKMSGWTSSAMIPLTTSMHG